MLGKPEDLVGGLGSGARDWRYRATISFSTDTLLAREVRVAVVETVDVFSSPISPVTAEESSEFSLVSWVAWLRTTVSNTGTLGLGNSMSQSLPRSISD